MYLWPIDWDSPAAQGVTILEAATEPSCTPGRQFGQFRCNRKVAIDDTGALLVDAMAMPPTLSRERGLGG